MWWYQQSESMKAKVRKLVRDGQLEMVNGGWSMHDEACPHYEDMINNHMIGHEFLVKEFGVKPRIGWQIDPFGHSNTNARIFAEMGYDALFFGRMDWADDQTRIDNKEQEWVWMPNSDKLHKGVQILTHKLYQSYGWTPGSNYDYTNDDTPFISNNKSESFNAKDVAQAIVNNLDKAKGDLYRHDHILQTWGNDFQYMNAFYNYKQLDRVIDYVNEHYGDKYFFKYSTPSEYIDAIAKLNVTWPTKYDDLFPYSDAPKKFWTGYFTSRANLKGYVRRASSFTHASNALYTLRALAQDTSETYIDKIMMSKYLMLDAMGIAQHHDAVAGTARQAVTDDYIQTLYDAMDITSWTYMKEVGQLVKQQTGIRSKDGIWKQCEKTNSTYMDCPVAAVAKKEVEGFSMTVAVHNPSSVDQESLRILVPKGSYEVTQFDKDVQKQVESSIECHDDLDEQLQKVESCSLLIHGNVPNHQISLFNVTSTSKERVSNDVPSEIIVSNDKKKMIKLQGVDKENGIVKFKLINQYGLESDEIALQLKYWSSRTGYDLWTDPHYQNSGAYVFIPLDGQYEAKAYTNVVNYTQAGDDTFVLYFSKDNEEMEQSNQAIMTMRYGDSDDPGVFTATVEVDLFGLPDVPYGGHEVVLDLHVDNFDNNKTFFTDSNALDMQKRILNHRPTWDISLNYNGSNDNVTANFYPVNSAIQIKDTAQNKSFTVMNDRSQAGTSLEKGSIQLMQNRRMFADDQKGVSEPLNEHDPNGEGMRVKVTYHIEYVNLNKNQSLQRVVQQKVDDPLQVFYSFEMERVKIDRPVEFDLSKALREAGVSETVKMVSFPIGMNKFALRLENLNTEGSDAHVNIEDLTKAMWTQANIKHPREIESVKIQEMSLTGNMPLSEMQNRKIHWNTVDDAKLNFRDIVDQSENAKTLVPQ